MHQYLLKNTYIMHSHKLSLNYHLLINLSTKNFEIKNNTIGLE